MSARIAAGVPLAITPRYIPGAPDDGIVMFRPVTQPKPTAFAQLALGYQRNPLKATNITKDRSALSSSPTGVVQDQLTTYVNAGFQFLFIDVDLLQGEKTLHQPGIDELCEHLFPDVFLHAFGDAPGEIHPLQIPLRDAHAIDAHQDLFVFRKRG